MIKKSKVLDVFETIFYLIVLAVIIVVFIFAAMKIGLKVSLLIICPILILIIFLYISMKKDEKKKKEYRNKFITEVIIKDRFFDKVLFEKDSAKNELKSKKVNILFGDYNPEIIIEDYDEKNNDKYFRSLQFVYERHSEIIENLLNSFLEVYSDNKEITPNILKDNFEVECIRIKKRGEYFLEDVCFVCGDDISEGDYEELIIVIECNSDKNKLYDNYYPLMPVAYFECKSKKMCWTMEE